MGNEQNGFDVKCANIASQVLKMPQRKREPDDRTELSGDITSTDPPFLLQSGENNGGGSDRNFGGLNFFRDVIMRQDLKKKSPAAQNGHDFPSRNCILLGKTMNFWGRRRRLKIYRFDVIVQNFGPPPNPAELIS